MMSCCILIVKLSLFAQLFLMYFVRQKNRDSNEKVKEDLAKTDAKKLFEVRFCFDLIFSYFVSLSFHVLTHLSILAELAERSPIIIQNSSYPSSRKNLDVRPYKVLLLTCVVNCTAGTPTPLLCSVVHWSVHWVPSRTTRVLVLAGARRCALETCGEKNASSAFRLG